MLTLKPTKPKNAPAIHPTQIHPNQRSSQTAVVHTEASFLRVSKISWKIPLSQISLSLPKGPRTEDIANARTISRIQEAWRVRGIRQRGRPAVPLTNLTGNFESKQIQGKCPRGPVRRFIVKLDLLSGTPPPAFSPLLYHKRREGHRIQEGCALMQHSPSTTLIVVLQQCELTVSLRVIGKPVSPMSQRVHDNDESFLADRVT